MPRITYSRLTIKEKPAGNEDADETGFPTCGRHHARQLLQMPVPGRSAWESAQYTWQGLTCHRDDQPDPPPLLALCVQSRDTFIDTFCAAQKSDVMSGSNSMPLLLARSS